MINYDQHMKAQRTASQIGSEMIEFYLMNSLMICIIYNSLFNVAR